MTPQQIEQKALELYPNRVEEIEPGQLLNVSILERAAFIRGLSFSPPPKAAGMENPYPESVFPPLTQAQLNTIEYALKPTGITPDRYAGNIGRFVWDQAMKALSAPAVAHLPDTKGGEGFDYRKYIKGEMADIIETIGVLDYKNMPEAVHAALDKVHEIATEVFEEDTPDTLPAGTGESTEAELYLHDTIDGEWVELVEYDEAKTYVKEMYIEGNEAHPDLNKFYIYKQVGEVGLNDAGKLYVKHFPATPVAVPTVTREDFETWLEDKVDESVTMDQERETWYRYGAGDLFDWLAGRMPFPEALVREAVDKARQIHLGSDVPEYFHTPDEIINQLKQK